MNSFPTVSDFPFVFEMPKAEGFWTNTNRAERAKSVLPIFGGTSPEATPTTASPAPAPTTGPAAGGDTPTPEQLADLMKQVADLTKTVTEVTTENTTYKTKQEQAEKATRTNEENLAKELETSADVIAKMDAVIKHTALVNAIQGFEDNKWHSIASVMAELQEGEFDITVDLENGVATVTGMDKALKRVAKDAHWLVKNDVTQGTPTGTPTIGKPGSGAPPAAPAAPGSPAERRASLLNRFPVIGAGRARIS